MCEPIASTENNGLRSQSVPAPPLALAQAARLGLLGADLRPDSACHRRFRSEAGDWNLGLRDGALHPYSRSSAVEPGEDQMENLG